MPDMTPEQATKERVAEAAAFSAAGSELNTKTLAQLADDWWATKNKRLAADKVAAALKVVESQAEALLLEQMRRQEITAIGGKNIRVSMDPEPTYQPTVKDWEAFYKYILKTKDFSLLERRPGKAAIKERWDDNKVVPGVDKFPVYKLSRNEV